MTRLGQLPDDGIVSGGDGVEDPVNPLQSLLVLDIDPVPDLIRVIQGAALYQVRLVDAGQGELTQPGEGVLLHHCPGVLHHDAGVPVLDGSGPAPTSSIHWLNSLGGVHQLEAGLVLVMIVSVLSPASTRLAVYRWSW